MPPIIFFFTRSFILKHTLWFTHIMMLLTNFRRQMFSLRAPTQPANPKVNITMPTTLSGQITRPEKQDNRNMTTTVIFYFTFGIALIFTRFQINQLQILELANWDPLGKVWSKKGCWWDQSSLSQQVLMPSQSYKLFKWVT